MSAARVQSTVSLGCADRLSQIRSDAYVISQTPHNFKNFPVFPLPFCVLRCYVCTPCDAPVSSLPCIIFSVDMHARVTPSHSTFSACR